MMLQLTKFGYLDLYRFMLRIVIKDTNIFEQKNGIRNKSDLKNLESYLKP